MLAMILGMSIFAFTALHVVLSLIGIVTGFMVLFGMLASNRPPGWTALFLFTTTLTSVTGFLFHSTSFGPAHVLGVISLVVLAPVLLALYRYELAGSWRWIYAAGATIALYLNVFAGIAQAFQKLPFLKPLAPTQSEPPFVAAQLVVLAIFILLGIAAVKRFHPETPMPEGEPGPA
jgi:hypothetical protein